MTAPARDKTRVRLSHVSEARRARNAGIQRDEAAAKLKEFGFENVKFVTNRRARRHRLGRFPEAGTKAKANEPVTVTVAAAHGSPISRG